MPDRSKDWLAQAKRDLEHAEKDVRDGYYEHACFEAQQAAEKAVKSVYLSRHAASWGHRVAKLLQEMTTISESPPVERIDDGKILDQYYVLTRYPNGFESGAPMEFFTKEQATDAVRRAANIIGWCESLQGSRT
jgi:HEPN domain-containing protein